MNVPQHVAIILDGNGRWAKAKGMPRNYGHAQGSKNVERICEEAWRMGIKYLTVYAFSTENWNRPDDEVNALMKLLRNYMKTCLKTAAKNDMKVRVIGDITKLDEDIQKRILELEEATKNNGGLNFQIAINYGSRDEITRAVRTLAEDVKEGKIKLIDMVKIFAYFSYFSRKGLIKYDLKTLKSMFFNGMNISSLTSEYCSNIEEELGKIAIEEVEEDMEEILKHFHKLNDQLLDKMYREKAEEIMKCIPMKMEQFYEKFDRECMKVPIFKYYDPFQLFQRISCASNEDIVLIKEKLLDRANRYTKQIEPEMKNIKQFKQIVDDYIKGKESTIKIVMLKEFSKSLESILEKYKFSF